MVAGPGRRTPCGTRHTAQVVVWCTVQHRVSAARFGATTTHATCGVKLHPTQTARACAPSVAATGVGWCGQCVAGTAARQACRVRLRLWARLWARLWLQARLGGARATAATTTTATPPRRARSGSGGKSGVHPHSHAHCDLPHGAAACSATTPPLTRTHTHKRWWFSGGKKRSHPCILANIVFVRGGGWGYDT